MSKLPKIFFEILPNPKYSKKEPTKVKNDPLKAENEKKSENEDCYKIKDISLHEKNPNNLGALVLPKKKGSKAKNQKVRNHKQAGAELGQAQLKLRLRMRLNEFRN